MRDPANMIEAATPVEMKTCCECGQLWPLTEFRFHNRKTGLRHTQCRRCYNSYMRDYVAKRRAKAVGEFVTRLNRTRLDLGPLELACIVLIRRFGGPVRFSELWYEQLMEATQRRPGSPTVLRQFRAIVRLVEAVDKQRRQAAKAEAAIAKLAEEEAPSVDQLSDEELEREMKELIKRQIRRRPGLVLECAEELGWTVEPPNKPRTRHRMSATT